MKRFLLALAGATAVIASGLSGADAKSCAKLYETCGRYANHYTCDMFMEHARKTGTWMAYATASGKVVPAQSCTRGP